MAIALSPRWQVWRLAARWKSQGRDIQWAEVVGFKLLTIHVCVLSKEGKHVKVHGDNCGVIEGWWKRCSGNRPTNSIFWHIHKLSGDCNHFIHTRYIPSKQNPTNVPSHGQYPSTTLLIHGPLTPTKLKLFLINTHQNCCHKDSCHQGAHATTFHHECAARPQVERGQTAEGSQHENTSTPHTPSPHCRSVMSRWDVLCST